MTTQKQLPELAKLVRYYCLVSTTAAGSGHPTSSLSAADLITTLMFGGLFKADLNNHNYHNNDRLIFSKGHAAPLLYSLYAAAGKVTEKEMLSLRQFSSPLEGHPTMRFKYTEAATGSLGQGLSIGLGMALNAKHLDKLPYKTFVLLGDSEMAEGSVWEAMQLATHYKLNNLVGIVDVNRLGQCGETMFGHNVKNYQRKAVAFGWQAITIDGHNYRQITTALKKATTSKKYPTLIIAKTIKGKGVSFIENKNGWHGQALNTEELDKALLELGHVNKKLIGKVAASAKIKAPTKLKKKKGARLTDFKEGDKVATRKAYGQALVDVFEQGYPVVALDAEVSNSTYAKTFKAKYPERFFEMFIAEQNMVGAALGLARRGKEPCVSTFAAFFTRAFDQIRMAQYSNPNITFVGSHAGVSIGADGSSQMALEDLAMFRSINNSIVLYPSDATSTEKLVEIAAKKDALIYIRTTRMDTTDIYQGNEKFVIGGSKVLRQSKKDIVTVVGAGVTLFEALKAHEELKKKRINIRVIDLYSIKPIDVATLQKAAKETKSIITVEDHYPEGGIGEAVKSAVPGVKVMSLAVRKMPRSGTPEQLMRYEEIDATAIIKAIKSVK